MGDCQARFREGLGCDSPAYSMPGIHRAAVNRQHKATAVVVKSEC